MKKILATAAALVVGGFAAQASADNSFNFTIEGQIPVVCQGNNNSIAATETVDLTIATSQTLGSVTYVCNSAGGFTRTISSQNSGFMFRAGTSGTGPNQVAYQLSSGGGSGLGFAAEQLTAPKVTNVSGSTAFISGQTGSISVVVPQPTGNVYAGTYSDVVTIAVTAN